MRTLEQILEGVTAGGRWDKNATYVYAAGLDGANVCACGEPRAGTLVGYTPIDVTSNDLNEANANAEYIVRSARHFPALVRALQQAVACAPKTRVEQNWIGEARVALAEALKN